MIEMPRRTTGAVLALLLANFSSSAPAQGVAHDTAPAVSTDRDDPAPPSDATGDETARVPRLGSVNVSLGDLPAGKTLTVVFRASVDAGPFAAGKDNLVSQGTVTGANFPAVPTDDPDTGAPGDATLTPLDAVPDLSLGVSDGGASTTPGGTVGYTLAFANTGSQDAGVVALASVVPAHTVFNPGASTAGWSCVPDNNPGSSCALAIGSLPASGPGSSGTALFAVTVVNPVPAGVTQIGVSATISDDGTNGPDPTPANNSGSDTTPLDAQPDLALSKSDGGATGSPGGTLAYTLTYSNVGNQGATGVVLTDTVPANTTFNPGASTAGWACVPDNNAGSVCSLAVAAELAGGGASSAATFAVTVANPLPAGVEQIANTASVADDGTNGPDPNGGNNSGSDTTPVDAVPDLSLSKDDGGTTTTPGATVAYTLSYANAGTQGATGVVLTDTVPAHTVFNPGASTAGWTCVPDNNAGSTCTLTIGAVPATGPGSSGTATFALDVNATVPGGVKQIVNTASTADDGTNGPDPTPGDNSSSDSTPLSAAPDLRLTLTDDRIAAHPGQVLRYRLTFDNVGSQDASGVQLSETVPAGTTFFAPVSDPAWTCSGTTPGSSCTLNVAGTVAPGAPAQTVIFAAKVDSPTALGVAILNNEASINDDGNNGPDPNTGNNNAADTNTITVPRGDLNRPAARTLTLDTGIARADILFQNDVSARLVGWFMDIDPGTGQSVRGAGNFTAPLAPADTGFRVAGTGDFDDDGLTDILFRHNADGRLLVWLMDGMVRKSELATVPAQLADLNWEVGAVGDLNGDSKVDIAWRNRTSGRVVVWLMNGVTRTAGQFTNPDVLPNPDWKIAGAGNFDLGSGPFDVRTDLLLHNTATGALQAWLMDNALNRLAAVPTTPTAVPLGWEVVAVADWDSDHHADLLLRNVSSGRFVTWFMTGTTRRLGVFTNPDSVPGSPDPSALAWRIVGPK